MVSLQDVATAAGVSKTTASFVLNGRSGSMKISEATAEKVRHAARDLGYVPNMAAKRLTAIGTNRRVLPEVALVWFPQSRPAWYGTFLSTAFDIFAANEALRANLVSFSFTADQPQSFEDILLSRNYNGILVSPEHATDCAFLDRIPPQTPLVVLHVSMPDRACVTMDYYGVGALAARVFAAKGFTDVGMVYYSTLDHTTTPDERFLAFWDVCRAEGMQLQAYPIAGVSYNSRPDRLRFGRTLAEDLIRRQQLPQAMFIQDDCIATAFLTTLLAHNIRVPEDMELVTYGDDNLAAAVCPTITTIDYPGKSIALHALTLISERMRTPQATPVCIKVPPTVTFRESCPQPNDWD